MNVFALIWLMDFVFCFQTTKKLSVSAVASSHILKLNKIFSYILLTKERKRKACSQPLNVVFRRKSDKETCDTSLQVLTDRLSWCRDFLLVNIRRNNTKAFWIWAVLSSSSLYHERIFIQEYITSTKVGWNVS